MKNPFVKHDNTALIASLAVGTVAAGAAAYLFMTEKGNNMRHQLMERLGFMRNESVNDNHINYLNKRHKQPKTDREELMHHNTITEQPHITN